MQRLLAFIQHNSYLIVLFVLQVFCGFLIFNLNPYQQAAFTHTASNVTAQSNQFSTDVSAYIDLKNQNLLLQEQVVNQFNNTIKGPLTYLNDTFTARDTARKSLFDMIHAEVVYNTTHRADNIFVINKGTSHGVEKNMGVISTNGLAGIVLQSNAKYSTVMSLLNTNMKLIPYINGSEYFSELLWENNKPNDMRIKRINKLEEIEKGDIVYTGNSSLLFPSGIPIGTISDITSRENSQYFETKMQTATDFRKLHYVYVIVNRDIDDILPLIPDHD